ncbi:MAG: N-formylglutamate amidohydrolase [Proteobacteria bacterium]|nr:N-formylglutamate amidohydrolase [Pseudomonadota bacterium]MDA1357036.1 N-formylglutamate amidohydrolase [Pseudomonadota bacterium]
MRAREDILDTPTNEKIVRQRIGDAVQLLLPRQQTAPLVCSSPHSGSDYKDDFLSASKLNAFDLRRSEDSFVDELFAHAPLHGAPLVSALFPRAYIDPNREPYELDPNMFCDSLPAFVKTRSDRVRAGFGSIARVVANGAEIYHTKLTFSEAEARIKNYYTPYHDSVRRLVDETRERFGFAILMDCHSMPSVGGPSDRDAGRRRADIVLGDRFGTSCASEVIEHAELALLELGFRVARNEPYAGAHTTTHYGRPAENVHAIQVEISRGLYMDEARYARSDGHATLTQRLGEFVRIMAEIEARPLKRRGNGS